MADAAETLEELALELADGRMTSITLVERSLDRVARLDRRLNSFVAIEEAAIASAEESDARRKRGETKSRLDGIPLSVKDSIHVVGLPSTWGSRTLAGFRPAKDELPVARLRGAGFIVLGKTNVPEFTLEGYTRNELFGVTRNPWNADLTPGGSTGGGAASVAAGLVPAAIGTDAGGSIRRPASHTGLVGFKPSIGRWPRTDGFPAILTDFETVGTLTRTVADGLLLDAVMKGPDPRDRRSLYASAPPWPSRRLCILYIARFGSAPVDPEVDAHVAKFASLQGKAMTSTSRMSSSTSMPPRASGMSSRGPASPGSCAKIRVTKIRPAPPPAPWPPRDERLRAPIISARSRRFPNCAGFAQNSSSASTSS